MKRSMIILASAVIALTSVAALAGCGSNNAESQPAATVAVETLVATTPAASSIAAEDAVFSYNGASVALNTDADAAVASLGEALEVGSQTSCHGVGEDKTYTYQGFILNTYPLDGKDMVLEVVIKDAGIPTSKGVQVGDSVSKVTETYGENFKKVGMYYSYSAGEKMSLQFFIENDTVKEIDYYYDV